MGLWVASGLRVLLYYCNLKSVGDTLYQNCTRISAHEIGNDLGPLWWTYGLGFGILRPKP